MLTAQATSAQAAMANLYELDAIAAAIIGGTLLSGGRGTIIGSLLGVIIFSTITNLFAINGLSTEAQNMVKGGIIVAAVLIQQVQFGSLTQFLGRNRATTTLTPPRTPRPPSTADGGRPATPETTPPPHPRRSS